MIFSVFVICSCILASKSLTAQSNFEQYSNSPEKRNYPGIDSNHRIHLQSPKTIHARKTKVIIYEEPEQPAKPITLGLFKGKIQISDNFNELPPPLFPLDVRNAGQCLPVLFGNLLCDLTTLKKKP